MAQQRNVSIDNTFKNSKYITFSDLLNTVSFDF